MLVPVGQVVTSSIAGQHLKAVVCDKCKAEFFYELSRVGVGKASAPILFKGDAPDRAGEAAHRDLFKRLDNDAELVPCPQCHWVNEELIRKYRKRVSRKTPMTILITFGVGLFLTAAGFGRILRVVPFESGCTWRCLHGYVRAYVFVAAGDFVERPPSPDGDRSEPNVSQMAGRPTRNTARTNSTG